MTFTSLSFLAFFPIVATLYYLCPMRFRWALLLIASCYFYMAFIPQYILILFAIILIDFFAAQQIERSHGHRRRSFLILSILANVGILFVFKYFNFFNANFSELAHVLHWNYSIGALSLILPLGLSFHTFQSLSYVIEVYRGNYPAERHLGIYALYVLFFPQLIAGPIERPAHLLPQLKVSVRFNIQNVLSGLRLMAWGFFKKLVIADRLAMSVDYIWKNAAHLPGESILLAIFFFAIQLYTDFSGYSDIARGAARVLGIEVIANFSRPYFSASVSEFWRRWHISLSSWFRDYIYIPLGGNRVSVWRRYFNVLVVFTVMGLWHGAGWTFLLMGLVFGTYLCVGLATKSLRERLARYTGLIQVPRIRHILRVVCTFVLVALCWTLFRAPNIGAEKLFLLQLTHGWSVSWGALRDVWHFPYTALGLSHSDLLISLGGILFLFGVEWQQERKPLTLWFAKQSYMVRSFIYTGMAFSIVLFGVFATQSFIYFQF